MSLFLSQTENLWSNLQVLSPSNVSCSRINCFTPDRRLRDIMGTVALNIHVQYRGLGSISTAHCFSRVIQTVEKQLSSGNI